MIAFIKGIIEEKGLDYIVINNNDIGYIVNIPQRDVEESGETGDVVKVFTYHYVREDQMALYGFMHKESLSMFKLLINVTGIGPKAALSILSQMSPQEIAIAVMTNDEKSLCRAQGIGKKTSQRIILELKDKLKNYEIKADKIDNDDNFDSNEANEAIEALMSLGYTREEAAFAVNKVYKEEQTVEDTVKNALKTLMKG